MTGSGYEPKGEILHDWEACGEGTLEKPCGVLRIGLLCNKSNITEEDGQFRVDGDPTEGALIVSAMASRRSSTFLHFNGSLGQSP